MLTCRQQLLVPSCSHSSPPDAWPLPAAVRKAFDVAPQEACAACGRTDSWEQMPVTEKDADLSVITLIGVCFSRLLLLHLLLHLLHLLRAVPAAPLGSGINQW